MKHPNILAATVLSVLVFAPVGFAQTAPPAGGALAPSRSSRHPTSTESLTAQAQDLTKEIQAAKAKGHDTTAAASEQAKGEQAMQQGNSQEALLHFKAGEHDLGMTESQSSTTR
jgi:hypothetical protein